MNNELSNKLINDFPHIFTNMKYIECGDGWFGLIYKICDYINKFDKDIECQAVQIKEKFGGLRFYVAKAPTAVYNFIDMFERFSFYVCEECGTTINVTTDGKSWVKTLCDKCRNKF